METTLAILIVIFKTLQVQFYFYFYFFSILCCCSSGSHPEVYLAKIGNIQSFKKAYSPFHIAGDYGKIWLFFNLKNLTRFLK
jgi:hypothetical protein